MTIQLALLIRRCCVAGPAESLAIRQFVPELWEKRPRLDVMRLHVSAPAPAFLAGVVIALKYLFSPVAMFDAITLKQAFGGHSSTPQRRSRASHVRSRNALSRELGATFQRESRTRGILQGLDDIEGVSSNATPRTKSMSPIPLSEHGPALFAGDMRSALKMWQFATFPSQPSALMAAIKRAAFFSRRAADNASRAFWAMTSILSNVNERSLTALTGEF